MGIMIIIRLVLSAWISIGMGKEEGFLVGILMFIFAYGFLEIADSIRHFTGGGCVLVTFILFVLLGELASKISSNNVVQIIIADIIFVILIIRKIKRLL